MSRTIALSLILVLTAPVLAAAEPIAGPVRLVLRSGATYDVPGPIKTVDGRWVFRDSRGRLLSLSPELVRDVLPIGSRQAAGAMKRSPGFDGALRYTNADLPPPSPEPPATTPESSEAAPAPEAAPPAPAPNLASVPQAVGGYDERGWRKRVAERRDEITHLEQQEHGAHRLLVCAQHGQIGSGGCDPLLRAKPNWFASTPNERTLVEQLRQTRSRLEERRSALTEFLDEAFKLGVPTSWLL